MSFGFGLATPLVSDGINKALTSKSITDKTSTTNTSTTNTLPDWASGVLQKGAARVGEVADLNPYDLVAPANALQNQAGAKATDLSGTPWNFDAAADLTRGAANTSWLDPYMTAATPFASGGKAYDYIDRYQNPFLKDVVDSTAADLDSTAGQVRAQQALDLAGSGAFGGSGAALTQSLTEGELARARASSLSGLRSQAFQTALGAASGDADRATQARLANAQLVLQDRAQKVGFGFQGQGQQLQAGAQLGDLSSSFGANERANIATLSATGGALRDIQQEQLMAPVTHVNHVVAALSALPLGLVGGQNTTSTETSQTKTTDRAAPLEGAKAAAQVLAAGGG